MHPLSITSLLIDNLAKLQPSMHLAASLSNGGRCSGTSSLHGRMRSTRTLRRPILRYVELFPLHMVWSVCAKHDWFVFPVPPKCGQSTLGKDNSNTMEIDFLKCLIV